MEGWGKHPLDEGPYHRVEIPKEQKNTSKKEEVYISQAVLDHAAALKQAEAKRADTDWSQAG
jgi:hypothetical protein